MAKKEIVIKNAVTKAQRDGHFFYVDSSGNLVRTERAKRGKKGKAK